MNIPTPQYTPVSATSPNRILHVLAYTPTDGDPDCPITVRLHCQSDLPNNIFIRLVVGQKPVHSRITAAPGPDPAYGQWQLNAAAPRNPPWQGDAKSLTVSLSLEALNEQGVVLDSVAFGHFTYWRPDSPPSHNRLAYLTDDVRSRRRRANSDVSRMGDGPRRPRTYTMPSHPQGVQIYRRQKAKSVSRGRGAASPDFINETPVLELVTPLEELCKGWDGDELEAGRRLISVHRVLQGHKLIVTCTPLRQEEYHPSDECVISCIYHEQTRACFVTSVDIIYLLERLTQQDFPVEEKNRIRRNLEGLRPTTVSKHRPGYEGFFQRIMDFPDPKPRNIEKDLKVFEFTLLGQALEKILAKYECRIPAGGDPSMPTLAPSLGRGGSPNSDPSEPRSSASPTMDTFHLPPYHTQQQLQVITQHSAHPMDIGIYHEGGRGPEDYSPTYSSHSASSYAASPASYTHGMKQGRSSVDSLLPDANVKPPVDPLHSYGFEVEPGLQYPQDTIYDFQSYPYHSSQEESIGFSSAPYVV